MYLPPRRMSFDQKGPRADDRVTSKAGGGNGGGREWSARLHCSSTKPTCILRSGNASHSLAERTPTDLVPPPRSARATAYCAEADEEQLIVRSVRVPAATDRSARLRPRSLTILEWQRKGM